MDPITAPVPAEFIPIETPPNPVRADHRTRITPDKARDMARRSAIIRAERVAQAKQAKLNPKPEPAPTPAQAGPDPFVSVSLARCRSQLDSLYLKLDDKQLTPAEIDKIASAIAKFSEIERNLAMRPGPGTLKPAETVKSQTRAGWLLGEEIPNKTPVKPVDSPVDEQE